MKILHFNYSLIHGGIETMLINIANEQVKMGHQIYILVLWNGINSSLTDRLDKRITVLPVNRPKGSANPYYICKLNYFLLKINPDVIHVHSAKLVDYIFIPWYKKRMCVTQHRMCNGPGNDRLKKFQNIFAISYSVKKDVKKVFGLESTVIYNGIDSDLFKLGEDKYSYIDQKYHIVQVGRLYHKDKGQHILVRAIKGLVESGIKNISVDFIGDGPSKDYIEELISNLGLESYCSLLGEKSPEFIYNNLHKYDIEVQPSISEGFGLTAAEAMAVRLPVIVSDQEALLEVIDNGKCGYVFKSGDYVDLSMKLKMMMTQGPDVKMLADGYERMKSLFDVKQTAARYIKCYKNVMTKELS